MTTNNIELTNLTYDGFFFEFNGYGNNKMIYNVYPDEMIDTSTFIDKMIYNDKIKFILSAVLGKTITEMKGYVDANTISGIYKMVLELTIVDPEVIYRNLDSFTPLRISTSFYPTTFGLNSIPTSSELNVCKKNTDLEENIVDNTVFVYDISLSAIDSSEVEVSNIYDKIIPGLEEAINKYINPLNTMRIDFIKTYNVTNTTVYNDVLNTAIMSLNITVFLTISAINGNKVPFISSSRLVIDSKLDIEHDPLDIIRYFYPNNMVYRDEYSVTGSVDIPNVGNFIEFQTNSTGCGIWHKDYKFFDDSLLNYQKVVCGGTDYIYMIYQNVNRRDKKHRYLGQLINPDENFATLKEIIRNQPKFKGREIRIVNRTKTLLNFMLIPK